MGPGKVWLDMAGQVMHATYGQMRSETSVVTVDYTDQKVYCQIVCFLHVLDCVSCIRVLSYKLIRLDWQLVSLRLHSSCDAINPDFRLYCACGERLRQKGRHCRTVWRIEWPSVGLCVRGCDHATRSANTVRLSDRYDFSAKILLPHVQACSACSNLNADVTLIIHCLHLSIFDILYIVFSPSMLGCSELCK